MDPKKLIISFSIVSAVFMSGCKKDNQDSNPIVIPLQITIQAAVPLATTSTFAILAGSAVTNTGATTITGDLGLSPGSSIGGFPPGILTGTQHINDITAT